MRVKDPRLPLLKKGCIKSHVWTFIRLYINEIGSNLKRLMKQMAAVKGGEFHAWERQHRVNWDKAGELV